MGDQPDPPLTPAQMLQLATIRAYLEQHGAVYHRDALHAKLLEDGHDPRLVTSAISEVFPHSDLAMAARTTTVAYVAFWVALLLFLLINLLVVSRLNIGIRFNRLPEPTLAECQSGQTTAYKEWCASILGHARQQWIFAACIAGEVGLVAFLVFSLRGRWRTIGRWFAAGIMVPVALALLFYGICVPPVQ